MRRVVTFIAVALGTAVGSLWWLHEGDLAEAVKPVVAEWDADLLARNAGLMDAPPEEEVGAAEPRDAEGGASPD